MPCGAVMVQRAVDADAVRIAAGEERRARGGAHRLRDVEVGEADALGRHAIEVGRARPGVAGARAEAADVGVAEIVGEDDDDVGQALRERRPDGSGRKREHQHARGNAQQQPEGRYEHGSLGYPSTRYAAIPLSLLGGSGHRVRSPARMPAATMDPGQFPETLRGLVRHERNLASPAGSEARDAVTAYIDTQHLDRVVAILRRGRRQYVDQVRRDIESVKDEVLPRSHFPGHGRLNPRSEGPTRRKC